MEQLLTELAGKVQSDPEKNIFAPPASAEDIKKIELITGIELPHSCQKFLHKFNGGFICPEYFRFGIAKESDLETARWNSLYIFSLEEMYQKYSELQSRKWKLSSDWQGVYPIIPVARAENNELLVIINPLQGGESPVFDAFHEDPVCDWGIIARDFTEFLSRYLASDGMLNTIGYDSSQTAADFLPPSGWKSLPEE